MRTLHVWRRLLRHGWLDESDIERRLGPGALERLTAQIASAEQQHGGEIRLCIEASLPMGDLWRQVSPRQRALNLFGTLRVWDTEDNNGVLIYLLLADRAIEIVADRALARQVPPAHWQATTERMRTAFQQGQFEVGLADAVAEVSQLLARHFPLRPGQTRRNELRDAPDLR